MNPKADSFTKGDGDKDRSVKALTRLRQFITFGTHWSPIMIGLLLRVLFNLIVAFNWKWTASVYFVAEVFCIRTHNVFKMANAYLQSDSIIPIELKVKKKRQRLRKI